MRRFALAVVTAGLVTAFAVPSFADPIPGPIVISPPVTVWFLADGGMCVQVEDQAPICSHPQPM